jgi:5'-nucleotidase
MVGVRTRPPPSAQLFSEELVPDPGFAQGRGEGIGVELRMAAGARKPPNVRDDLDLMGAKKLHEALRVVGRMPDRVDLGSLVHPAYCLAGPPLESGEVRVLLTNDDGIGAAGLHALRRALGGLEGVETHVIAPNSNRSATARSITTRSPLEVEEVELDDGTVAYATDGTPVDCVRFGELGLVGDRPELILSGINHGSNLGDDITYSGTVAAALEGIVLGIPAVAISQQSRAREMSFAPGPGFDFGVAARFGAELVRLLVAEPLPAETLLNVNCPAEEPRGIEVTRLGKRLYNDELRLVGEDGDGRRHYQIYGFEPSFEDEPGTDLSAVANGRISITPVHFDLTDRDGLGRLRGLDLERMFRDALAGTAEA